MIGIISLGSVEVVVLSFGHFFETLLEIFCGGIPQSQLELIDFWDLMSLSRPHL